MDIEKIRYLILAVQRQGERALVEYFKEIGVTPSQAEVLRVIQEESPLSLKELGERLICETGSPSRLLTTLVNKGFVNGQEAENDRRVKRLTLTSRGRAVAAEIKEKEGLFYKEHYAKLPAEVARNLIGSLALLIGEPQVLRTLQLRGIIKEPEEVQK
jgi:DNA-binding MarR family transcriptional regulator